MFLHTLVNFCANFHANFYANFHVNYVIQKCKFPFNMGLWNGVYIQLARGFDNAPLMKSRYMGASPSTPCTHYQQGDLYL